ncbi:MAG: Minf_1886 family protein [Planctomycetota bacterium]
MSQQQQQEVDWKKILAVGPYPIEAFAFVREGFDYAVKAVHEDPSALAEADRHITGQQLCLGLRESAIEQYGLLAPVVLEHWNIRRTCDFGRIVFALIDAGLMTKTPSDSLEDFQAVYDFDEAFSREALLARIGAEGPSPKRAAEV